MNISFSTILTTILLCSILILIFHFLLSDTKFIRKVHYLTLLCIASIVVFRLFFPIELSFTKTIPITFGINQISDIIYYKFYISNVFTFRVGHLLLLIWICGFLISIAQNIHNIYKIKQALKYSKNMFNYYSKQFPYLSHSPIVGIYFSQNIEQPSTFFLKKPVVVLPDIHYDKVELTYILQHEQKHIKNKDILIKYILLLLNTLYWWFPPIKLFTKDINLLLELRVDSQMCFDLSEKERKKYIKSLILVAKKINHSHKNQLTSYGSSFTTKEYSTLKHRVTFYLNDSNKIKKTILTVILSFFLTFSFPAIVFEPYHHSPVTKGIIEEDDFINHHYLIENNDGSYSLIEKKTHRIISTISNIHTEPFNKMKIISEVSK
ncbi:M56 family metallopeptidase [Enterococcus cecorum]